MKTFSKWVQDTLDERIYSLDTPLLQYSKHHLLFVYGTLRKGFYRHSALSDATYVGNAWTCGRDLVMFRRKDSNPHFIYPVVMRGDTLNGVLAPTGAVWGEVYLVKPSTIITLDFIESNGIQYRRTLYPINIHSTDPSVDFHQAHAWTYLGTPAAWENDIKHGRLILCDRNSRKKVPNFHYYIFKRSYLNQNNNNKNTADNAPLRNM